jgi:hypothetical protein
LTDSWNPIDETAPNPFGKPYSLHKPESYPKGYAPQRGNALQTYDLEWQVVRVLGGLMGKWDSWVSPILGLYSEYINRGISKFRTDFTILSKMQKGAYVSLPGTNEEINLPQLINLPNNDHAHGAYLTTNTGLYINSPMTAGQYQVEEEGRRNLELASLKKETLIDLARRCKRVSKGLTGVNQKYKHISPKVVTKVLKAKTSCEGIVNYTLTNYPERDVFPSSWEYFESMYTHTDYWVDRLLEGFDLHDPSYLYDVHTATYPPVPYYLGLLKDTTVLSKIKGDMRQRLSQAKRKVDLNDPLSRIELKEFNKILDKAPSFRTRKKSEEIENQPSTTFTLTDWT